MVLVGDGYNELMRVLRMKELNTYQRPDTSDVCIMLKKNGVKSPAYSELLYFILEGEPLEENLYLVNYTGLIRSNESKGYICIPFTEFKDEELQKVLFKTDPILADDAKLILALIEKKPEVLKAINKIGKYMLSKGMSSELTTAHTTLGLFSPSKTLIMQMYHELAVYKMHVNLSQTIAKIDSESGEILYDDTVIDYISALHDAATVIMNLSHEFLYSGRTLQTETSVIENRYRYLSKIKEYINYRYEEDC